MGWASVWRDMLDGLGQCVEGHVRQIGPVEGHVRQIGPVEGHVRQIGPVCGGTC